MDSADGGAVGQTIAFVIGATDGADTSYCVVRVVVRPYTGETLVVTIGSERNALPGATYDIPIVVTGGEGTRLYGFDYTISFDTVAMTFDTVIGGQIFQDSSWVTSLPFYAVVAPGVLRLSGHAAPISDLRRDFLRGGDTTVFLRFTLREQRISECSHLPVRWYWPSCDDNLHATFNLDTILVSDSVFGAKWTGLGGSDGTRGNYTDPSAGFPTYGGVVDSCVDDDLGGLLHFRRQVNFENGDIEARCVDSIDYRGDMNLNGIQNEIADYVVYGMLMLKDTNLAIINIDGQVAASEINGDGRDTTVSDMVFLMRVITGDTIPLPRISADPDTALVTHTGDTISIDHAVAACRFIFQGELDASQISFLQNPSAWAWNTHQGRTIALYAPTFPDGVVDLAPGNLIACGAQILEVDLSDHQGAYIAAKINLPTDIGGGNGSALPTEFALRQNYPNPFNPKTTIVFDLPHATSWALEVFNISGQRLVERRGANPAGTVSVEFEADNWASGVYFYRLTAGEFVATRKMALLK